MLKFDEKKGYMAVLREIEDLALQYPGGPDLEADALNTRPNDMGAHLAGLIIQTTESALRNSCVTQEATGDEPSFEDPLPKNIVGKVKVRYVEKQNGVPPSDDEAMDLEAAQMVEMLLTAPLDIQDHSKARPLAPPLDAFTIRKAAIIIERLRARLRSQGNKPPKPRLKDEDFPHTLDACIKYMDYLAIEGIAGGTNSRIGGMCLNIAQYLERLKRLEGQGNPQGTDLGMETRLVLACKELIRRTGNIESQAVRYWWEDIEEGLQGGGEGQGNGLDVEGVALLAKVREAPRSAKYAEAPWLQPEPIGGVWLRSEGSYALVEIEVDGVKKLAIREHLESNFSHYISAAGIRGLFDPNDIGSQYAALKAEAKPEPRSALGAEGPNPTVTPTLRGEGVEGSEGKGEP